MSFRTRVRVYMRILFSLALYSRVGHFFKFQKYSIFKKNISNESCRVLSGVLSSDVNVTLNSIG